MKKVLLLLVMITSISTAFGSSNMGEDQGLKECKDSLQNSRRKNIDEAKKQIIEETKESTQQSNV